MNSRKVLQDAGLHGRLQTFYMGGSKSNLKLNNAFLRGAIWII